jgi:branched-chain amino acid transport system permease protein
VTGPVVGALILEPLQQYFTLRFSSSGAYLIAYGLLFLIVMQFLPQGVLPSLGRLIRQWNLKRTGRARSSVAPTPPPARVPTPVRKV